MGEVVLTNLIFEIPFSSSQTLKSVYSWEFAIFKPNMFLRLYYHMQIICIFKVLYYNHGTLKKQQPQQSNRLIKEFLEKANKCNMLYGRLLTVIWGHTRTSSPNCHKAQKADWGPCPYRPKGKTMLAQTHQGQDSQWSLCLMIKAVLDLGYFFCTITCC